MTKKINIILIICFLMFVISPIQASEFYNVDVGYQGHINNAWLDFSYGGALAGSEGGETLDSLSIHLVDAPYAASIEYRVYTISGWSEWVNSFESASHKGEAILGLQVQLKDFPQANVYYQSYRQGLGWGIWVSDGKTSGTLKEKSPITGFRVQVDEIGVSYLGINQSIRHNGETQGSGQSINSVSMSLITAEANQSIEYRAYLSGAGWTDWARNGVTLGSSNSVIEALEARLIGLPQYSVQIQPQVNGEWWGYVYDGQTAGTINNNQSLTSYRVEIVQRVYVAPTVTNVVEEEESTNLCGLNLTSDQVAIVLEDDGLYLDTSYMNQSQISQITNGYIFDFSDGIDTSVSAKFYELDVSEPSFDLNDTVQVCFGSDIASDLGFDIRAYQLSDVTYYNLWPSWPGWFWHVFDLVYLDDEYDLRDQNYLTNNNP